MFKTITTIPTNQPQTKALQQNKQPSFFGVKTSTKSLSNTKAINKDGDSLRVSFGSNQYQQFAPANIYPPFRVTIQNVVNNLINAADGMTPYTASAPPSWQAFPQRNSNHQLPGFKADLSLNEEHTFNKTPKDGGLDARETILATNQLKYDSMTFYPQGTQEQDSTTNASLLLNSVFQGPVYGAEAYKIRPEFDPNMNGLFDAIDAQAISCLDGNPHDLSSADLNIASTNFVMNRK